MPQTTTVSNAQELSSALQHAAGGDTIVLRAGNYGALDLKGYIYASNVTITSQAPLGAQFTRINLTDVDNVTFKSIGVAGQFSAVQGSKGIVLSQSDVNGGVYFKDSANVVLKLNDITTPGEHAAIFNSVDHVTVVGNNIHDARSDLLRIGGDSDDVRIASNYLLDTHAVRPDHPDLIQMFGYSGNTPSNVRIVGNIMHDDPATGEVQAQGVFISTPQADGGYRDILVKDNIVNSGSANSIFVNGGVKNVVVTGNTLPVWPNGLGHDGGGSIRVVEEAGVTNSGTTISNNVARQIRNETTSLSDGIKFFDNTIKTVQYDGPTAAGRGPAEAPAPAPAPTPVPPPPAPAPTGKVVGTGAELTAALKAAAAGDTIVLKAGNYGALTLNGTTFAKDVKLVSQTPEGAKFGNITLSNVDHLSFDGIAVTGEFKAWQGSTFVSLLNSDVNGSAYFMDSNNIVVRNNDIDGLTSTMNTLTFNHVSNVQVLDNVIHDARSDILRITGDSHFYDVSRNILSETHSRAGDHPDMVSTMAINGVTPTNLKFTQNVLYDNPATQATAPAQGFFIHLPAKDGYKNILIEDNLVAVPSINSVFVNGAVQNFVVRDNVLATSGGGATIRIVEMAGVSNKGLVVDHNIARQVLDETSGLSAGMKVGNTIFKNVPITDMLANWNTHAGAGFADVPHDFGMADLNIA